MADYDTSNQEVDAEARQQQMQQQAQERSVNEE